MLKVGDDNPLGNLLTHRLPFDLELLPPTACLVGGAVRDGLLNREGDYLDLDFVLPELAVETARKIAHAHRAGFVVLDEQRQIARVVFPQATVDFALQEGESLEKDLQRRDFTLNAIAYNPKTKTLIDPLNGVKDIKEKLIRMVAVENLKDDPLRLLRAYRQAAQLNFTIEINTRESMRNLCPLITKVAAERVRTELGYLLKNNQGTPWIKLAWEDGILPQWLKSTTKEKIQLLEKIDLSGEKLAANLKGKTNFSVSTLASAKLAMLVAANPEQAELELERLKYTRAEIRTVTTALKLLPRLLNQSPEISLREQYFLFLDAGNVFPVLAVLGTALGANQETILPLMHRYLEPKDQVAHPQPLVTGNDLMKNLNLRPSPEIGKLLTEIQLARIEGKIATVEEALKFAYELL